MKKRPLDVIKNPPVWLLATTYTVAIISIVLALVFLLVDVDGVLWQVLTYVNYGVVAISLGYSIYTFVYITPRVKQKFLLWADKRELTRQMISNYGVRTIIFAIGSFALSIAFGAYNLTLSALERSVWYGVLAAYYILLALMRGGVITYHSKKRRAHRRGKVVENEKIKGIKRYRNCGIMLIIMTIALAVAVLQMVLTRRTFTHTGLMIYVSAVYTCYKITMAIINLVKARKQSDITVQAIRNINLADATVSILALQTSMIHTFGSEGELAFADSMNATTGGAVCILTLALGILMVVKGQRLLKIERSAETNAADETNQNEDCDDNNVEE